ncbi:MAG: phosphotransferase [Betaproteobacteria bacterium]
MITPAADLRLDAIAEWLAQTLRTTAFTLAPASADASFRRYFRASLAAPHSLAPEAMTLIVMDAPPPQEDCRPFVHVAALLHAADVHAPAILAQDLERGFLLLSDLGHTTYLDVLDESNARALYVDAIDALLRFQCTSRIGVLPPYNEALLQRELALFPDWYVARHLVHTLTPAQRQVLDTVFALVIANNLAQPQVFVHRDFHSRNLMVSTPNPGFLDFQDAVYGPITYDLVSLLRDAYIGWDEERQIDLAVRYWERARKAGVAVHDDFGLFWRDFEWMGAQRQLKVLGIFARLCHRDGKDGYVENMPLVMSYLRGVCTRYRQLEPLLAVLDALDARPHTIGYTF